MEAAPAVGFNPHQRRRAPCFGCKRWRPIRASALHTAWPWAEVMIERDNRVVKNDVRPAPRRPECAWIPTSAVDGKADAYGTGPPAENSTSTCMKQNGRVLLDKDGNETCRHDLDQWRKASDDCLSLRGQLCRRGRPERRLALNPAEQVNGAIHLLLPPSIVALCNYAIAPMSR